MSADQTPPAASDAPPSETPARISHKSFRRKYRKIMVQFEEKMTDSTAQFKDEQRMLDISLRLSEQNNQILDLLNDLNDCPQIPARFRYDLDTPGTDRSSKLAPELSYTPSKAQSALKAARKGLSQGQMTTSEYRLLEDDILTCPEFKPRKSYISLKQIQQTRRPTAIELQQEANFTPSGALSREQEDKYLEGVNEYLAGKFITPRPHAANGLGARSPEKSVEREKLMQLKNPVSVYNWLRKHQPQVFLQDNESHTEKQLRGAGSRSSKRMSTLVKQEAEALEEEGIPTDIAGSSSRGKRKRDDDGGYRPKGGNSRPGKRKKEDTGSSGRRSAKHSISELVS